MNAELRRAQATHEEWADARAHRDGAAVKAARALVNGDIIMAKKWAQEFDKADDDMHRIRLELDGTE